VRAVVVDRWMEPSELRVGEAPRPEPGPGELLVEVRAAGCNFADTLMVRGEYQVKPDFPFVPGHELAGVVTQLGAGVRNFAVGDSVCGFGGRGAFAELACLPEAAAVPIPDGVSFDDAAAIPTVYPTSYLALVDRAQLARGETLLVHAAAGGVGLAAVQIGKALGARVIATAGGADKLKIAEQAGADVLIDYRVDDFREVVLAETEGRGADVIYDSVGGDTFDRSLKCIAWGGRLLVIGFASGRIPEVKANRILLKNIAIVGLHWGPYLEREPERVRRCFEALFEMHRKGQMRPLIGGRYSLEELPQALSLLASRKSVGKLIVHP
jgi:NADPH2:quinone reductase